MAGATGEMVELLDRHGPAFGLDPAGRRLVADAYLVELWLRTAELAAGGWLECETAPRSVAHARRPDGLTPPLTGGFSR